jgi:prolyl-tRNA synthetase
MTHGDNRGIIIPPKIAPIQIDIIEIMADKESKVGVISGDLLKGLEDFYTIRVDKSKKSGGFKASQSEIEGVPVRIEIGPREAVNDQVIIVRRDTLEKTTVNLVDVKKFIDDLMESIQQNLLSSAEKRLKENIVVVKSYDELKEAINKNQFALAPIVDNDEFELKIKEETTATARCIPLELKVPDKGVCLFTGQETNRFVIYAKSY